MSVVIIHTGALLMGYGVSVKNIGEGTPAKDRVFNRGQEISLKAGRCMFEATCASLFGNEQRVSCPLPPPGRYSLGSEGLTREGDSKVIAAWKVMTDAEQKDFNRRTGRS